MSNHIEVFIPDIGSFKDVAIIEVLVAVGDSVEVEDTILVLESDKTTLDVPTAHSGRVVSIKVAEGEIVNEGSLVMVLEKAATDDVASEQSESANGTVEPSKASAVVESKESSNIAPVLTVAAVPKAAAAPMAAIQPSSGTPIYASPSIRRYARILGVEISTVTGTGPRERITREDVEQHVKSVLTSPAKASPSTLDGLPAWPEVDFAQFGPVERQPLSRIALISGPVLSRNAITIPHVTNSDKADATDIEQFRKILNAEAGPNDAKVSMLAFAVKAVVLALKAYPKFNSSLDGDELVIKNYWNIGVAADTPGGLMVPVIKEADQKGIREIALEMAELSSLARNGKLKAGHMQGATFTISSLGGIGGTHFTPIINAPEVAILGMTRAEMQPVWDGTAFQPRLIQPLNLSWDHRVVDGVAAARFLVHVSKTLGDFRRVGA